ncbi:MAG: hypothetical protein JXB26_17400 [Candidatus Aminicenantes bacterium]|nr:hypothetical protein [Candidatus Aminicenantes bacterium]
MDIGGQNETGKLLKVLMKHPKDAFRSQKYINAHWGGLNYLDAPDYSLAVKEFEKLLRIFEDCGVEVNFLPFDERTGMDSLYVRDAGLVCERGAILSRMGKEAREGEPAALADYLKHKNIPCLGEISGEGRLEGGDVFWMDDKTMAVGEGYRTNAHGISQLKTLLEGVGVEVVSVPLPHWKGPRDVLHLMSLISPVGPKTVLVYSRLLGVPFRNELIRRDFHLIEVPDGEYETMAGNVLCLGQKKCLMLEGNPITQKQLESEDLDVFAYGGTEISFKGAGGPTCLTRPLLREDQE